MYNKVVIITTYKWGQKSIYFTGSLGGDPAELREKFRDGHKDSISSTRVVIIPSTREEFAHRFSGLAMMSFLRG